LSTFRKKSFGGGEKVFDGKILTRIRDKEFAERVRRKIFARRTTAARLQQAIHRRGAEVAEKLILF
jgi:hypothetical protein